jgi:hypothetical protein
MPFPFVVVYSTLESPSALAGLPRFTILELGRDVVDKRRIESVSHIEIRIVHAVSMAVVNRRRAAKAEPQSELEFIASIYALRYIQR